MCRLSGVIARGSVPNTKVTLVMAVTAGSVKPAVQMAVQLQGGLAVACCP